MGLPMFVWGSGQLPDRNTRSPERRRNTKYPRQPPESQAQPADTDPFDMMKAHSGTGKQGYNIGANVLFFYPTKHQGQFPFWAHPPPVGVEGYAELGTTHSLPFWVEDSGGGGESWKTALKRRPSEFRSFSRIDE